MDFDLSEIKYSKNDLQCGLSLPTKMSPELAEFLGIMIGDGHVGLYKSSNAKNSFVHYEIEIAGNKKEYDYYKHYVNELIYKIFNIKFNLRIRESRNSVLLSKNSKALYYFLSTIFEIPPRKDNVMIPEHIFNGDEVTKSSFLRGYADADFCLMVLNKPDPYPRIRGASISSELIKGASKLLQDLGIENYVYLEDNYYRKRNITYHTFKIDINGKIRVKKFLSIVGFSNKAKLERYKKYTTPKGFEPSIYSAKSSTA